MLKHDNIVKICYISSTFFEYGGGNIFTYNRMDIIQKLSQPLIIHTGLHIYIYENNCWFTFLVNNITSTIYFVKIMVTWHEIKTLYMLANQYYINPLMCSRPWLLICIVPLNNSTVELASLYILLHQKI